MTRTRVKNGTTWAREVPYLLSTLATLVEDIDLVPQHPHHSQLTVTQTPSSGLCNHLHACEAYTDKKGHIHT